MKTVFNTLIFLCVCLVFGQPDYREINITQLQKSSLHISGKTNVAGFKCFFNSEYLTAEKKIAYSSQGDYILLRNAKLELDLDGFNCGGKAINKDFRAMLKAEHYPVITLDFKQLNRLDKGYEALVIIALAGQNNTYTIPVEIFEKDLKHLKGILKLNISDYNLKLPKKMFGLIKIKDVIAIEFDIAGTFETEVLD